MLILVTEKPDAQPGKCRLCGVGSDSDRTWWIDTGVMEEWYGAVYYCSVCFTQMADMVGFLSPEQATKLKVENDGLREQIRIHEDSLDRLLSFGIDVRAAINSVQDLDVRPLSEGSGGRIELEGTLASGQSVVVSGPDDIPTSKPRRKGGLDLG